MPLALRLLLVLLLLPSIALGQRAPDDKLLAITGVTVIDATGPAARPGMTVLLSGNRVADIGEGIAVPAAARRLDGTGKFLIPGLWDMHVHATDPALLSLFLANGVTGLRIMWGIPSHLDWRRRIAAGAMEGPRLYIASGIVDGPTPVWRGSIAVGSESEGRWAVAQAKNAGVDFVKVYSLLPRPAYFAIADEAKKLGIPFAGHVPNLVSAAEASDAGQRSIEHLTGIMRTAAHLASYNEEEAQALFARFVRNGTWQSPTLTVIRGGAHLDDPAFTDDARLKYVSRAVRQSWDPKQDFRFRTRSAEDYERARRIYRKDLEVVGAMHRAGVPILAGTDVGNPYCFAGFSLHDELELLVQAGLEPGAALNAATRNAAEFTGQRDSLGSVEKGKLADLVLLDANPLENIGNTRKIRAVIVNGRVLDRQALDDMLAKAEAAANR